MEAKYFNEDMEWREVVVACMVMESVIHNSVYIKLGRKGFVNKKVKSGKDYG